jgi:hypothetical protein
MQLADALEATLPQDFAQAADVIEASLAPPLPLDALGEPVALGEAERDAGISRLGALVARRVRRAPGHD